MLEILGPNLKIDIWLDVGQYGKKKKTFSIVQLNLHTINAAMQCGAFYTPNHKAHFSFSVYGIIHQSQF